jgi:glycosyltransferase involved in cell wall biosynthesis
LTLHHIIGSAAVTRRVLLVVPWDQAYGGVNTVVRNLASALRERKREPLFLFPGDTVAPKEGLSRLGFPAVYMNLRPPIVARRRLVSAAAFTLSAPAVLWHLVRLVLSRGIEVVNVHYLEPYAAIFVALRQITGVRLVTSVHGSDLTGLADRPLDRPQIELALRHSDVVIAPSLAYADYVRGEFPNAAARVIGIPNAVDVDAVVSMAAGPDVSLPHAARDGTPYFLCVAALTPKKAHDTLLRAFATLRGAHRLLLVGDGPMRGEVERLIEQLGLSDRVFLLGEQPPVVVAKLLAGATGSVLSSRDEPFGIAAVESMAVGTPVVATDVGGLAEIVEHERTGLVVPVDDVPALAAALERVARDGALRARLGNEASARAHQRFDREVWASDYLAAFSSAD